MPALSRSSPTVASITADLRAIIGQRTVQMERAVTNRLESEAHFAAGIARKQDAIQKRRERIVPLARRGLRHLMALAQRSDITQMIRVAADAHCPQFDFYRAVRMSGDAWDNGARTWTGFGGWLETCNAERMVTIVFLPTDVHFYTGSNISGADSNWALNLSHTATPLEHEALIAKLLPSVEFGARGRTGLDETQTTHEWDPDELLIHVLAECVHKRNRDYYLAVALKQFMGK